VLPNAYAHPNNGEYGCYHGKNKLNLINLLKLPKVIIKLFNMKNNEITITDIDIPLRKMIEISVKIWFATLIGGVLIALPLIVGYLVIAAG